MLRFPYRGAWRFVAGVKFYMAYWDFILRVLRGVLVTLDGGVAIIVRLIEGMSFLTYYMGRQRCLFFGDLAT